MTGHISILDTRAVMPRERREYWSTGIAQHFFPVSLARPDTPSFDARLISGRAGPIDIRRIQGHAHHVMRTTHAIAAGDPECLLLYLLVGGSVRLEQDERACALAPGDFAFHDSSRPSLFQAPGTFDVVVFSMPRWFLGTVSDKLARSTARVVPGNEHLARVARPFLTELALTAATGPGLTQSDGESAAAMLLPFLSAVAEPADPHGAAEPCLLDRIKGYAAAHLREPDLGPARLAQAHFVSTRYVHRIFAATGIGVSEWIRDQRLDAALAELRDSRAPIADLAVRWGYRSPTAFSRAFRTRFGLSPREARAGALPQAPARQGQARG